MQRKILVLFIVFLFLPFSSALADTNTQSNSTASTNQTTGLTMQTVPPLLQHIDDAKLNLRNVDLKYNLNPVYHTTRSKGKTKKTLVGYALGSHDVALAIWDPTQSQTDTIIGTESGNKFSFNDPNISVRQIGFNGVNTRFVVNQPAGGIVLAGKFIVSNVDSGSKTAVQNGLEQAIYVPYSPDLNTYAVAQFGGQYLDGVMNEVADELANQPSQSIPGETITQAIKPSIIKALLYAEHMDTSEFLSNQDTQSLINQVNILYATNGSDTFKYSVSSGNARGIAQFLPSTYIGLAKRHPEAQLMPDPVIGLANHVNAIKAEYLLIDDYIAAVHAKIADDFNPAYIYDYGAASYNGGVSRVVKAVETFGDAWNLDRDAQVSNLQIQINGEQAGIKVLKAQVAKAKGADKTALNNQLTAENSNLADLRSQLSSFKNDALRTETVLYLDKMHKLISIFNAQI